MEKNSNVAYPKFVSASRTIFYSSILLMLSPGLLLISTNPWLQLTIGRLFLVGATLMLISWLAPGIFIFVRTPWLALAWLQGIGWFRHSFPRWEQLSKSEKRSIYIQSVFTFLLVIFGIIFTTYSKLKK